MAAYMDAKGFDVYRQQIWNQGASIVDQTNAARSAGKLTAPLLATAIVSLTTLMASFYDTYIQVRKPDDASPFAPGIPGTWIDSRFHDYYDFFTKIIGDWEAELRGMQAATSTTVAQAPTNTGSTSQFSSANTTSQADAAGTVQPQAPYVPPTTGVAPTMSDPYTVFEQSPVEPASTQSASMSPLLIGGLIIGALYAFGKKRGAAK